MYPGWYDDALLNNLFFENGKRKKIYNIKITFAKYIIPNRYEIIIIVEFDGEKLTK